MARDAVTEDLRSEMDQLDAYEKKCPECMECGNKITGSEYYWDFNGWLLCEGCVRKFRRSVEEYVYEQYDR